MERKHLKTLPKVTNGGDEACYDIWHLINGNQNAIVVEKVVISSDMKYDVGFKAVGVEDDKIIWSQRFSFTIETLKEIAEIVKDL